MFTGIVEAVGTVVRLRSVGGDQQITVTSDTLDLSDVKLGDSIATNGACLTVTALAQSEFTADVSQETLRHTTLQSLKKGSAVNLEKAMAASSRFGGHLVSGHVDGVGEIILRQNAGRSVLLRVRCPQELAKYVARKGSITIDGVSLTVNDVNASEFDLMIIPHSQQQTTLLHCAAGTSVNIEVDLIARYLERLVQGEAETENNRPGLTQAFLAQHGFARN